jgi:predicted dithiol-disulfide oxidoreductase (DUF899 family)
MSEGLQRHLNLRGTSFVYVSRARWTSSQRTARAGWTVPWYSAYGSDFNYDFHLTLDESVAPLEYNDRNRTEYEEMAVGWLLESEQPVDLHGHSCFLRDGDRVFHTYSSTRAARRRSAARTTSWT